VIQENVWPIVQAAQCGLMYFNAFGRKHKLGE